MVVGTSPSLDRCGIGCLDKWDATRQNDGMTQLTVADVTYEDLAAMIDHSLLRPELTLAEVEEGCRLADQYAVISVCCRPADVIFCADILSESTVEVGTVVSFPHGSSATATKVFEVEQAIADGATELDMVLNIGWLRSGRYDAVRDDIAAVVEAASGVLVKVILENAYLDDDQKRRGSVLVEEAGADFVKTSTGFAPSGATIPDLVLMREAVSENVAVKAAGGVRTLDDLLEVRSVGVSRIGATRTAEILDDYRSRTS